MLNLEWSLRVAELIVFDWTVLYINHTMISSHVITSGDNGMDDIFEVNISQYDYGNDWWNPTHITASAWDIIYSMIWQGFNSSILKT